MTQMYDPHQEWDEEDAEPPRKRYVGNLSLIAADVIDDMYRPLRNMTDRAHERNERSTSDSQE